MSATADAGKFSQYFSSPVVGAFPNESERPFRNAPIIEVDSGEPHAVNVYYKESLQELEVSIYCHKKKKKNYDPLLCLVNST